MKPRLSKAPFHAPFRSIYGDFPASSVSVGIASTYGARYLPRMPQQTKRLRKELLEARERILRQINICVNDPNFNAGNAGAEPPAGSVPVLMAELKQIGHALESDKMKRS